MYKIILYLINLENKHFMSKIFIITMKQKES